MTVGLRFHGPVRGRVAVSVRLTATVPGIFVRIAGTSAATTAATISALTATIRRAAAVRAAAAAALAVVCKAHMQRARVSVTPHRCVHLLCMCDVNERVKRQVSPSEETTEHSARR